MLTRNLHDVFGERDPARSRAAIDELFTDDSVFYAPNGVHRGRDDAEAVTKLSTCQPTTRSAYRCAPGLHRFHVNSGDTVEKTANAP